MTEERIEEREVRQRIGTLNEGWNGDTQHIARTFTFDTFAEGIDFVRRLGAAADEQGHHPDIDIRWTSVLVDISTHSAGGVTDLDFTLARTADEIAADM